MTNAQRNKRIVSAIAKTTKHALSSKKAAKETLIKEGIYTQRGKLRAKFGGERKRETATV